MALGKVADIQASATVDWSPLGAIYVKRTTHYLLDWKVNLAENIVAIAPYGGPVALIPKIHGRSLSESPCVSIYSQSGILISSIPWEGGRVMGMGWTSSENLVCILEEGTMAVYTIHGHLLYTRPISREIREHRVLECKFFQTLSGSAGFAVMTNCYQFFVVADSSRSRDEIRVKKLPDLPSLTVRPSCWNVLTPQCNALVAVEDKLYVLDQFEAILQTVVCKKESAPYWAEIAVSMDGKALALVDKGGYLWGGSSDFKVCETEFDLQSTTKVLQMAWGSKDFFVLIMDKLMFVKGFGKHWCKYSIRGNCCLLHQEIDGLKVLTDSTCEFMHRVTTQSLAVLKIGSLEVGALLNDAYKEYEGDESHKADEYIRYIKDRLPEAVSQCIKAAGEEFEPSLQQSLLKSANFGKGFLGPDVPSEVVNEFVEMCHHLRVLNSVRIREMGIPITLRQYYRLSTGVFTDRLTNRGLYPLALEVCNYLKIPALDGEVKILRQWAMRKVQDKSIQDEDVADVIINKLKSVNVVFPFAEIARSAKEEGRNKLAGLLLGHEVHAREQVPLLMEMRKADDALDKAIESGDPQLVYRVLDELKSKQYQSKMDSYLQLFHRRPVAAALYKKLCKETDREQLFNIYHQESECKEAGCLLFSDSFLQRDASESDKCLNSAMQQFRDGQHTFELRVTDELLKLQKEQEELQSKLKLRVIGMPLFRTVLECIKNRQMKAAEQLRKDFKMSDNQYWWAKIQGLASIGDYEELERFSRQKKSPIGYEPFAEMCIQRGNKREAAKYILKCAAEARYQLYIKIDDLPKAADIAFQEKNIPALDDLLVKAGRRHEMAEYIRGLKDRLVHK